MNGNATLKLFYLLKPLIPRIIQIRIRRFRASRIMANLGEERLRFSTNSLSNASPWLENGHSAVLLTHDVESFKGLALIPSLLEVEREAKVRSCWNFVAGKYHVDMDLITKLKDEGHEIGVHGLYHDGKLFSSQKIFSERMPLICEAADKWGAKGFRSPSLLYDEKMLATLPFAWDSSIPAWDPFQPQPGGSGKYIPYPLSPTCIELPVTTWQDFTLFEELRMSDISVWKEQAAAIHSIGGLINIIIHPDYVTAERLIHYKNFLRFLLQLENCSVILPSEACNLFNRNTQTSNGILNV